MVLIGGESSVRNGMQLAITHYFATSLICRFAFLCTDLPFITIIMSITLLG